MEAKNTDSVGETGAESSSETDSKKSYFELQSYKTRITDIYEFHDYESFIISIHTFIHLEISLSKEIP